MPQAYNSSQYAVSIRDNKIKNKEKDHESEEDL